MSRHASLLLQWEMPSSPLSVPADNVMSLVNGRIKTSEVKWWNSTRCCDMHWVYGRSII